MKASHHQLQPFRGFTDRFIIQTLWDLRKSATEFRAMLWQPTKVGLNELTSCRKILADTQEATNIYPGVFGLFKQVYIPAFWSLTASCRLETDTVAKFSHISELDTLIYKTPWLKRRQEVSKFKQSHFFSIWQRACLKHNLGCQDWFFINK